MSYSCANSFPLPSLITLLVILLALHGLAQPNFDEYLRQLNKRSPMKKSDGLRDFVGSLNGAARLRYGKRSGGITRDKIEETLSPYYWATHPSNGMDRWKMAKRASNYAEALPVGLLDQLNGAERLRFGRK